jgi:hypothetical protein
MARFRRNLFTNELEELPSETTDGRALLYREEVKEEIRCGSTTSRPHHSTSGAVNPLQAERMTEEAKKAGIPIHYDRKTGALVSDSRGALRAEAKRRGMYFNG